MTRWMRLLAETMNCKTTSVFDLGLDLLYKVQMTREAGGGPSRQTLGVRNAKEHQGQQLLIISHLIFYHCTEKNETLCDKNLGDQLFSLFAIKTNKRKSRLSSICEIWICASSERACMSGFTGILLIPVPFSRSQKAMFVCVWSTGWVSDGDSDQISVRDPPALPRQRQPLPPRHRNLWDAPQRGRRTSWQHD